jgi:hypothetical protein
MLKDFKLEYKETHHWTFLEKELGAPAPRQV